MFFAFWANKGEKGKTKAKNGRNRKKIIRGKRAAGPEAAVCHRATRGRLEAARYFLNELWNYNDLISDLFQIFSPGNPRNPGKPKQDRKGVNQLDESSSRSDVPGGAPLLYIGKPASG